MKNKKLHTALWSLFSLLFIYLILRAWFVEPLKDELLTFYFFVEPGTIIDDVIIGDEANNHLLNSFAAYFLNSFDNGNFFLMRLPNLLAFPLFFYGLVKLVRGTGKEWQQLLLITSVVCVPFYFEYFAACRGYGLAFTALVWVLYFTRSWFNGLRNRILIILYFAAWLMVFANLSYLVLALICLGTAMVFQVISAKAISGRKHFSFGLIHALFFLSLIPFVNLASELREAGALYYGSMDGFWRVTAKSILRYTVFYEANWLKFALGGGFVILFLLAVRNILKEKLVGFFKLPETVYLIFLAGNVAAIFFLAKVKNINYPEDRVAMHLVLLTILLLGTFVLRSRFSNSIVVFAFFPLVFLTKINLDSSVISPDDRMNRELYAKAARGLNEFSTVGGYHTLPLMWTWNERNKPPGTHSEMQVPDNFYPYFDYIITRADLPEKPDSVTNYKLIASHERSMFKVWKRKKQAKKKFVFQYKSFFQPSDNEYMNFAAIPIEDSMRYKPWLVQVSADLKFNKPYNDVFLVYGTVKKDGSQGRYEQFNLSYSYGLNKKTIPVRQNFVLPPFTKDEAELRVYIWNRQRTNMYFYNGLLKFYEILEVY